MRQKKKFGGNRKNENQQKHNQNTLNAHQRKKKNNSHLQKNAMEASIKDTHCSISKRKTEKEEAKKGMGCDKIELPTYGL